MKLKHKIASHPRNQEFFVTLAESMNSQWVFIRSSVAFFLNLRRLPSFGKQYESASPGGNLGEGS